MLLTASEGKLGAIASHDQPQVLNRRERTHDEHAAPEERSARASIAQPTSWS